MSAYYIIPKSCVDEKEAEDDNGLIPQETLNKATKYAIESKWPIKHGDLGRLECQCGMIDDDGDYDAYIDMSTIERTTYANLTELKQNKRKTKTEDQDEHNFLEKNYVTFYIIGTFIHGSVDRNEYYLRFDPNYTKKSILVRSESAQKWNSFGNYTGYDRNTGMMIWNVDKFIDLDFTVDEYGSLPKNFILFEEPDYFEERHWHKETIPHPRTSGKTSKINNSIVHNGILYVNFDETMLENIEYMIIPGNKKDVRVYCTHWIDCRGRLRKLAFDNEYEIGDGGENDGLSDFKEALLWWKHNRPAIEVELYSYNVYHYEKLISPDILFLKSDDEIYADENDNENDDDIQLTDN